MRCERCAGVVVTEHVSAGATSNESWAYREWRFVNCGAMGLSRPAGGYPVSRRIAESEQVGEQRCA